MTLAPDDETTPAQDILALILCAAFFGLLGVAIHLSPGWGDVFGQSWVTTFDGRAL